MLRSIHRRRWRMRLTRLPAETLMVSRSGVHARKRSGRSLPRRRRPGSAPARPKRSFSLSHRRDGCLSARPRREAARRPRGGYPRSAPCHYPCLSPHGHTPRLPEGDPSYSVWFPSPRPPRSSNIKDVTRAQTGRTGTLFGSVFALNVGLSSGRDRRRS